jgi:hypothetical protein
MTEELEFDPRYGQELSPPRPDRSGVHPASYPVGTGGSFSGGQENVDLYIYSLIRLNGVVIN